MATISDRARDFWDRISPRERRLVVFAAIAAPLTLAVWLGLEIHDGLNAMEVRNDKARHALEVLDDLRAKGGQSALPSDDVIKAMPNEPVSLDVYLNKAAQKAGFPLKSVHRKPTQTRNGFITAAVSIDVDPMTIDDLKTFLQAVETDSKYVAITRLTVKRNRSAKEKVDASLDVSAYGREAPKAEAPADGGSAGSAGSAGSGKGT
jgi:enoyl reductase-like protein